MKNDMTAEQLQQPVNVTLPLSVLLRINGGGPMFVERAATADIFRVMPAIGAEYEGGIYAGVSLDSCEENFRPAYAARSACRMVERPIALVLLPGERESIDWKDANEWAKKEGGTLPSRVDQLVLFKNLKAEFTGEWYWSCEQYAGAGAYAWCQTFGDGGQDGDYKGTKLRARAVRRLPIL